MAFEKSYFSTEHIVSQLGNIHLGLIKLTIFYPYRHKTVNLITFVVLWF